MKAKRIIKKYQNRRLYDTTASKHVTTAEIRDLVIAGVDLKIIDDATDEDLTRQLLLQIIVEREQAGQPMLSEMLLTQLIRFYGNPMQGMMASYLQNSVSTFVEQQQTIQQQMQNIMSATPMGTMQDMMTSNLAAFEKLFNTGAGSRQDAGAADDDKSADNGDGEGKDKSKGEGKG